MTRIATRKLWEDQPLREGVKLDNSTAWDRNLTVRVDFATTIRAWDRGLTLHVTPVATT